MRDGRRDNACRRSRRSGWGRRFHRHGSSFAYDCPEARVSSRARQCDVPSRGNLSFHGLEPFDAIVGRLVLELLPETKAIIGRLCGLLKPGGIIALQEPTWKIWLAYTAHLPLRTAVTTLIRDTFVAGGVNTEMEVPLYQGLMEANVTPRLRIDLPIGYSPEFRSLLYDLLLSIWPRAEAFGLPLDGLGDAATLASRLNDELDARKSFAAFVGLVGACARKRSE